MTKFDQETLVKLATQTEKALTDKTLSAISNLSPDVVLHQDAFTLNHDIKGEEEVKKYLQAYFDKYEYEHDTLGYGVNPDSSCSFALSYDKVTAWRPHWTSTDSILHNDVFRLKPLYGLLLLRQARLCNLWW